MAGTGIGDGKADILLIFVAHHIALHGTVEKIALRADSFEFMCMRDALIKQFYTGEGRQLKMSLDFQYRTDRIDRGLNTEQTAFLGRRFNEGSPQL